MTVCACPLCGQQVQDLPVSILPERGMVVANGRFATLTGSEMQVLEAIVRRAPAIATRAHLMDDLYALRAGDEPLEKIIDVFVCKVRKKLSAVGVEIVTHRGKGYSLAIKGVRVVKEIDT